MKTQAPKKSYITELLIIFTALLAACCCSSCCCYCNVKCVCTDNRSTTLEENFYTVSPLACNEEENCQEFCGETNVSIIPVGLGQNGCYESTCEITKNILPNTGAARVAAVTSFRDEVLAQTRAGRAIIDLFYRYQQNMILFLQKHPGLQKPASTAIDFLVSVMETMIPK